MFKIYTVAAIFCKLVSCNQEILSKFNQHEYKIKDFRIELCSWDKDFSNDFKIVTYKYNRTTAAVNASWNLKYDVEDKLEIVIQANKKASNQYRRFPIRMQLNFQQMFQANALGLQSISNCGNIKTIYFLKDIDYYFCNFVTDATQYPPLIPSGEYKNDHHLMYKDREIALVSAYGVIYRPASPPKK